MLTRSIPVPPFNDHGSIDGIQITKDIDELGVFHRRFIERLATCDITSLPVSGLATNRDQVVSLTEVERDVTID